MTQNPESNAPERRADDRETIASNVSVRLLQSDVTGPTGNLSSTGVYFIAKGNLPVEVRLEGRDETLRGEIVRVGSVREGELGIAIRFLDEAQD